MRITQIYVHDIKAIADQIEAGDYNSEILLSNINGKTEIQKVEDAYDKFIIRNVSASILAIIIDCKKGKIKAISFNGFLGIKPKELFTMFGDYREGYSAKDDLYFYFFNENKKVGNFIVSLFEPSHKQINIHESNQALSNLTLSWE